MDSWHKYEAITEKLKKRFFKKPNYQEASNEYLQLARDSFHDESMLFSAFCYLASARCEDALKNYSKKALLTLTSARTYILNALDPLSSKMNFFASINEAVNVYNYAIELYEKVNCRVFAASLLVELAVHLQRLGQYQESIFYYKKYLRSTHRSSVLSLAVLKEILYCYFKNGDYEKALVHLDHVTDCQRIPINSCESKAPEVKKEEEFAEVFNFNNNKSDIVDAEITRLLLTLLLIHTEELVSPQYHNYCKKYSYEESDSPIQDIEEHLFYLLQSFVFGITSKDSKSCLQLTELLRSKLSQIQIEILDLLMLKIFKI